MKKFLGNFSINEIRVPDWLEAKPKENYSEGQ
jgi:hypothetical protein